MNSRDWSDPCDALLAQRRSQSLLRQRKPVRQIDAVRIEIDGDICVNFASNNYLGLTHHPRMLAALADAAQYGAGSGAAALISGYAEPHAQAERDIAAWKGTESAILLPSGYQANLAAVQTIAAIGERYPAGVRFLVDKLAHASLIDAVRATGAPMRVFPHNGLPKLRRLLEQAEPSQLQVVLTESIFSMDGDACALEGISQLKQEFGFFLLLDEAHGSGVYGPAGAGYAAERGLQHAVDASIVTLSKAIGASGGAVCCSNRFADALVNFGRSYIYTTNVPPSVAVAASTAVAIMRDEPQRQQRVRRLAKRVRTELSSAGVPIPPGDSPIIPIVVETESAALGAAETLKRQGMFVVAVRPPTVPPNSSRLRVTLCSEHTDEQVGRLIEALRQLRLADGSS